MYQIKIDNPTSSYDEARKVLIDLIQLFADSTSNIREYDEFYKILINWLGKIINLFIIIIGRKINNSYIESRSTQIEYFTV